MVCEELVTQSSLGCVLFDTDRNVVRLSGLITFTIGYTSITVYFQTLKNNAVTIRSVKNTTQVRKPISEI